MQVVPVIDLKSGRVVHAVGGRRDQYQPLDSPLIPSHVPLVVAHAFQKLGYTSLYIADLDSIQQGEQFGNWSILAQLLDLPLQLWVDVGPRTAAAVDRLRNLRSAAGRRVDRLIVGLENVASPALLPDLAQAAGPNAVFSLDLADNRPVTPTADWNGLSDRAIARLAVAAGFRRLLLLDVRRVGVGEGPTSSVLKDSLGAEFPDVEWSLGGGVRQASDLDRLRLLGFQHVLVSTAIHRGWIAGPPSLFAKNDI
jgi:phosphoribosylformimino-5-aminoimidazole carboxamide ribotide isomerase